MSQIVEKCHI